MMWRESLKSQASGFSSVQSVPLTWVMHLTTYIGKHSLLSLYSFYLTLTTPLTLVTMVRIVMILTMVIHLFLWLYSQRVLFWISLTIWLILYLICSFSCLDPTGCKNMKMTGIAAAVALKSIVFLRQFVRLCGCGVTRKRDLWNRAVKIHSFFSFSWAFLQMLSQCT